jgi:hypothetical protein
MGPLSCRMATGEHARALFITGSASILSIAVFVVCVRIWTRAFISHNFGWEDSMYPTAIASTAGWSADSIKRSDHYGNCMRAPNKLMSPIATLSQSR